MGAAPGTVAALIAASAITRSPALSQTTADRGLVVSGAEYSGWAWSTYSRAPLVRITLASPRSSSVSWVASAASRVRSNPRASRSGFSSSKSHRARLARHRDAILGLCPHHPANAHTGKPNGGSGAHLPHRAGRRGRMRGARTAAGLVTRRRARVRRTAGPGPVRPGQALVAGARLQVLAGVGD